MNKKLLLILISSILTLSLLIFFIVVSWEVFVEDKVSLPITENVEKTCSELDGNICLSSETCSGSWLDASDNGRCCGGGCRNTEHSNFISFGFNTFFGAASDDPNIMEATLKDNFKGFNDLGIDWIRGVTKAGIRWEYIEPTEGNFNFELTDILMVQSSDYSITFLPVILPYTKWVQGCYGNNPDSLPFPKIYCEGYEVNFINYVEEVVERYDGDEDFGNYEISEETKDAIRNSPWLYWEIMNEPYNHYFEGTSDEYEQILDVSYSAIKAKCPNCNVLIGGFSQEVYYSGVYGTNPGGQSIPQGMQDDAKEFLQIPFNNNNYDIMNFHAYTETDLITEQYNYYNHQNIWMTEVGFPSKELLIANTNPQIIWGEGTSEKVQAETLVKRFVVGFSLSIEKIFWNTWHDTDIGPFGNTGVISTQKDKKLSYYSFKILIEKLKGTSVNDIKTIQESDNVYIYKFTKNGEPVWVAWWDYFEDTGSSKTISLDVGDINSVKITEAVPDTESGADLDENNYPDFFKTETKTASGGKIEIVLGKSPVFIEGE